MPKDKHRNPRLDDPSLNDSSMPSITNPTQALRAADEAAGVTAEEAKIPAPADAVDLAYRTALADVDAQKVGKEIAEEQLAGVADEDIDVQAKAEGSPATTKSAKAAAKK